MSEIDKYSSAFSKLKRVMLREQQALAAAAHVFYFNNYIIIMVAKVN